MRASTIVYDVSSRESFEALPRWLEELENYVAPEVVKIVVGNKLDKVSGIRVLFPLPNSLPLDRPLDKSLSSISFFLLLCEPF